MLADNMAQLAWTCDKLGEATWYNERWLDYTGRSLDEMMQWGWTQCHHPDHVDRVVASVKRSRETGQAWEETFPLRGNDGQYRWFLSRAIPIRDENNQIVRWFGTNTDVTEQRLAEEALRDADHRKDEFLAMLAHELRNPLAPIRTGLQLLQLCGDDRETTADTMQMMDRQLQQLVHLIDDLLDISRITRGKIELRRETCELATILSMAIESSRPAIEAAGVELTVALPRQKIVLNADPVRLSQVFSNLLTNAAKFTDRGGHIWLSAERCESELQVAVRDTGIGIRPEMLACIFEKFTQADHTERSRSGLGIGLSLVRALVELHGGTVHAHSDGLGQGSEFKVRLPILREVGAARQPAPNEENRDNAPRRVLVVDDNRDAAHSLSIYFKAHGPRGAHRARWPGSGFGERSFSTRLGAARFGDAETKRLRIGAANPSTALGAGDEPGRFDGLGPG